MPYSKRALSLLSGSNKELNLFNNAWAFTLTQHFLPFLQLHDFLNIGKGISDDIARRFPVYALDFTDGTLANVYGSAAPSGEVFFLCDVMSCLQCAFGVCFWYV